MCRPLFTHDGLDAQRLVACLQNLRPFCYCMHHVVCCMLLACGLWPNLDGARLVELDLWALIDSVLRSDTSLALALHNC